MAQKIAIALNSPFRDLVEFALFCVIGFTVEAMGAW